MCNRLIFAGTIDFAKKKLIRVKMMFYLFLKICIPPAEQVAALLKLERVVYYLPFVIMN